MSNEAARWLKKHREDDGLSFRELGKLVGVSHTVIADAEEGKGTTETWIKLAEHYGESVLRVLYWAKKMKRPPSENDVVAELQNRITVKILEEFPENEWESVLRHVVNDVEWLRERRNKTSNEAQSRRHP